MPSRRSQATHDASPGVSASLNRTRVIDVACEIADREGIDALTLSRVAVVVDRHVSSLYTHVVSVEALHREVVLRTLRELGDRLWRAALARTRGDALEHILRAYRTYLCEHSARGQALLTHRPADDEEFHSLGRHVSEPLHAALRSFGVEEAMVGVAARVLAASARGFAVAESTGLFPPGPETEDAFTNLVALHVTALEAGTWPKRAT